MKFSSIHAQTHEQLSPYVLTPDIDLKTKSTWTAANQYLG